MIELNSKTQQDFLNREWMQKLKDAGMDISDAKYCIIDGPYHKDTVMLHSVFNAFNKPWIEEGHHTKEALDEEYKVCPTYTVSELRNKVLKYHSLWTLADALLYKGTKPYIEALAEILLDKMQTNTL